MLFSKICLYQTLIGHININSIRHKVEMLSSIVRTNIDILIVSETKIVLSGTRSLLQKGMPLHLDIIGILTVEGSSSYEKTFRHKLQTWRFCRSTRYRYCIFFTNDNDNLFLQQFSSTKQFRNHSQRERNDVRRSMN